MANQKSLARLTSNIAGGKMWAKWLQITIALTASRPVVDESSH